MKRTTRFTLNTLAPAAIATNVMAVATAVVPDNWSDFRLSAAIGGFLYILIFAYIVGFIPSLIHAGTMDVVHRKYDGQLYPARIVTASTLSGTMAGSLIAIFFSGFSRFDPTLVIFIAVGTVTGLLNGLLVVRLDRRALP